MIYIDTANIYSKGRYWCHMVSDTSLEELHQFAHAIGMSRSWYQPKSWPHYDITGDMLQRAVHKGCTRCDYTDVLLHNFKFIADRPELYAKMIAKQ